MNKFYHSIILLFLLVVVNAATAQSPGGVSTNNKLWLKANTGVSTLAGLVTGWSDQSGSNNASTVNGVAPTVTSSAINSYPAVNFGGSGGLQGAFGSTITASTMSAFIVTNTSSSTTNTAGLFCISSSGNVDTVSLAKLL
jgi:hypothetical protein